jgi:phosphoglycolate phosphatase
VSEPIRTLIFDWDGTLHDTRRLYGNAFRTAYQYLVGKGLAPAREYTDEEVSIYLGMNAPDMWNAFMPELPEETREYCSSLIGQDMVTAVRHGNTTLYPGTTTILERLKNKGYHMVFLSNCKYAYMTAHKSYFRLNRWFDGFYCCEDFAFAPKEDIFLSIQEAFPGNYAVIGDRASDLKIAEVHHLPFIGCTYGFGAPGELAGADLLARDVRAIPKLLDALQEKISDS